MGTCTGSDSFLLFLEENPSKYDEIDQLSFGISIGGIQNSLDQTTFDLVDYDPLISGLMENTGYFNMDVGMSYVNSKYYAHLTIKNLLFFAVSPRKLGNITNKSFFY